MDYLRVSSKSSPASVAGAIAGLIIDGKPVVMQAIGAGAVNQAIKALTIARGFTLSENIDLCTRTSFAMVEIDGLERTAIKFDITRMECDELSEQTNLYQ